MNDRLIIAVLSILVFLGGCSRDIPQYEDAHVDTNVTLKTDREIRLATRFVEYWHLRSQHEFEKSFEYELPSYRFLNKYKQYEMESRSMNRDFTSTLKSFTFDPNEADVATIVREYQKNTFVSQKQETWMYVNGEWFHKYYFSVFP